MSYQAAMTTALENTYVLLAMMEQVGREENIENRMDIAPAMARAEQHLDALWKEKEVQYPDFKDVMDVASKAAHQIWNPSQGDFLHRQAIRAVNDQARAENWHRVDIDKVPYIQKENIESIHEAVVKESTRVVGSEDLTSRGSASVLAGAEAIRELSETRAEIRQKDRDATDYTQVRLPRVTDMDRVEAPLFNAWSHCVGVTKALPESGVLQPLLHQAKTQGEVSESVVNAVATSWKADRPDIPGEWVDMASELLGRAVVSENMTDSDDPVQYVAKRLAHAASFQSKVARNYHDLADQYSASMKLTNAIEDYRGMHDSAQVALEQIDQLVTATAELPSADEFGPMGKADLEKLKQLEHLKGQLAAKIVDLPDQLEELAQRIRAADPDQDQGPRLAMG
jgi:hypothetical protein